MFEYSTKFFGIITLDETKDVNICRVKYNGNNLDIWLPKYFINNKDKLKICIDIVNKYIKINEMAKKQLLKII